jgi:pimeloyl-ACP methyl ester carboxylesterase
VTGYTRFPILVVALAAVLSTPCVLAEDGGIAPVSTSSASYILVGFVGGFVRHDNQHQGPVQLAKSEQRNLPKNSFVQVFENRHRKDAYRTILHLLDRNHDGNLSKDEKSQAHIILFGHSWGASAVVLLARELKRAGVSVLLTVQVDSVAKPWQHDDIIPDNVMAAVNFYQPNGFIHGRQQIRAADQSKTQILGNYRFDYHESPVKCEGASWFDRIFTPDHMQSDCDPHLWSQVESLVRQRIEPEAGTIAALPGQ